MSGTPHRDPVVIAKETVSLARETGSPAFEKAARWALIASAAVTAVVGLMHAVRGIARDLTRRPDSPRHEPRPTQPRRSIPRHDTKEEPPVAAETSGRSWADRTRHAPSRNAGRAR
jgi:hypothetical protein